jgi:hypothetical protein
MAGAIGGVLAGLLVDRLGASLKTGIVSLYFAATLSAGVFLVWVFVLAIEFVPVFLAVLLCGLFANAAAPITFEMAIEMTYPVGEETSATLLVVLFSAVQLAFIWVRPIAAGRAKWVAPHATSGCVAVGLQVGSYISAAVMNWGNVLTLGVATALLLALPNIRSPGRSACPESMLCTLTAKL